MCNIVACLQVPSPKCQHLKQRKMGAADPQPSLFLCDAAARMHCFVSFAGGLSRDGAACVRGRRRLRAPLSRTPPDITATTLQIGTNITAAPSVRGDINLTVVPLLERSGRRGQSIEVTLPLERRRLQQPVRGGRGRVRACPPLAVADVEVSYSRHIASGRRRRRPIATKV